mgnify:FL=1
MCGCSMTSRIVCIRATSLGGFAHHACKTRAYPLILGRPWLRGVRVRQDWHRKELELLVDRPHGQRVK